MLLLEKECLIPARLGPEGYAQLLDKVSEFMNSVLDKVPKYRLRYINDFLLNGKKSRLKEFLSNSRDNTEIDLFAHPAYFDYVNYLIDGPNLPQDIIDDFIEQINNDPHEFCRKAACIKWVRSKAKNLIKQGYEKSHIKDSFGWLALDCASILKEEKGYTVLDSFIYDCERALK